MASEFVKGERVVYVQGDASEPAQIVKVHWEDGPPPYYSVRVLSTGRERQTDAAHLAKEAPLETVVRAAASVRLSESTCLARSVGRASACRLPAAKTSACSEKRRVTLPP